MSGLWPLIDVTHVSTLKYPFTVHKQNCFGTKDQDRKWGGGSWTLFEERSYISIEQLLSVFWCIVRLTPGFPSSSLPPKILLKHNRKISITKEICITIDSPLKKFLEERKADSLKILVAGTECHYPPTGLRLTIPQDFIAYNTSSESLFSLMTATPFQSIDGEFTKSTWSSNQYSLESHISMREIKLIPCISIDKRWPWLVHSKS